jgi:hypothetical protein
MNAKDQMIEHATRQLCAKHRIFDNGTGPRCLFCECEDAEYRQYLEELARVEP